MRISDWSSDVCSSDLLLLELQTIYGDTKAVQRDQQGYAQAMQEHQYCGAQIQQLSIELQNRDHMATELGEQVAAVISGMIGSIGSRSDERRVGQECVSTCRSRCATYN